MKNFKEKIATLLVLIGSIVFTIGIIAAFIATSINLFYIGIIGMFIMLLSVGLSID